MQLVFLSTRDGTTNNQLIPEVKHKELPYFDLDYTIIICATLSKNTLLYWYFNFPIINTYTYRNNFNFLCQLCTAIITNKSNLKSRITRHRIHLLLIYWNWFTVWLIYMNLREVAKTYIEVNKNLKKKYLLNKQATTLFTKLSVDYIKIPSISTIFYN